MYLTTSRTHRRLFQLSLLSASCLTAFQSYAAIDCAPLSDWDNQTVYTGGQKVRHLDYAYQANYWTQGDAPDANSGQWSQWKELGAYHPLSRKWSLLRHLICLSLNVVIYIEK